MGHLKPLKSWLSSLWDAMPPYHIVEGALEGKEAGLNGTYYIRVGLSEVEVDKFTFDALTTGETLRVRYTRAYKAINIDRLVSGEN